MLKAQPTPIFIPMPNKRIAPVEPRSRAAIGAGLSAVFADRALLRLMSLLSPAFPVGSFSYSHGIEFANEAGLITEAESLRRWVRAAVMEGSGRIDAQLLLAANDAALAEDWSALLSTAERAACLRGTAETALESAAQGEAFLSTVRKVWGDPRCDRLARELASQNRSVVYPVAVGAVGAWLGIPADRLLPAYLHAFAANLISAGLRLIPLGQTDGQRILAALESDFLDASQVARARPFSDLGSATAIIDWASMRHETQYTRLFRS